MTDGTDNSADVKWTGHPIWLVGFRSFFLAAGLAGVALPLLWALVLSGAIAAPTSLPLVQWHAHEMFYGFGMAVLAGFLLTATKNWVKVRGHHGRALQILVAAWLLERLAMWWGGPWPRPFFMIASHFFLVALVVLVMLTLVRHRATDSYRDNVIFLLVLPLFIAAKALLLSQVHFALGRDMTLALFRVAFLIMIERTLSPFMKAAFQIVIPRNLALDTAIKGLGLVLVFAPLLPSLLRGVLCLALASLVLGRFALWSPHRALTRLDLAAMYFGGTALAGQLALDGLSALTALTWGFSMSVHVFSFGTMGVIIPAMVTRIAKGHTGRPVVFDAFDKTVLWVMLAGFLARVVAPQFLPAEYTVWLWVAASCWAVGFSIIVFRIAPLVMRPRIDGKEH